MALAHPGRLGDARLGQGAQALLIKKRHSGFEQTLFDSHGASPWMILVTIPKLVALPNQGAKKRRYGAFFMRRMKPLICGRDRIWPPIDSTSRCALWRLRLPVELSGFPPRSALQQFGGMGSMGVGNLLAGVAVQVETDLGFFHGLEVTRRVGMATQGGPQGLAVDFPGRRAINSLLIPTARGFAVTKTSNSPAFLVQRTSCFGRRLSRGLVGNGRSGLFLGHYGI